MNFDWAVVFQNTGMEWQAFTTQMLATLAIRAVGVIVIGVATLWLARRIRGAVQKSLARARADAHATILVGRLAQLGILLFGAILILGVAGIDWTALLAIVGAFGLAISLALQDVLKGFVAGIYLLIERPFRVGETIKIKEYVGRVEGVGIRTTVLRTEEGERVLVPNATVFAEVLVNKSTGERNTSEALSKGA